jgi:hypothetical protein
MFALFSVDVFAANGNSDIDTVSKGDPQRYNLHGNLTAIENNDSVTIDGRGYSIDPAILVVDESGRPTSLVKFILPAKVIFEYAYIKSKPKTMSPVIVYIKEIKEDNGRSMQ